MNVQASHATIKGSKYAILKYAPFNELVDDPFIVNELISNPFESTWFLASMIFLRVICVIFAQW